MSYCVISIVLNTVSDMYILRTIGDDYGVVFPEICLSHAFGTKHTDGCPRICIALQAVIDFAAGFADEVIIYLWPS